MGFNLNRFVEICAVAIGLTLAILAGGCSLQTDDQAPFSESFEVGNEVRGCLADYDVKMNHYFHGAFSGPEMQRLGDCVDQALEIFSGYTRGKSQNYYTAEELHQFLKKYFLNGDDIPEGLRDEFLHFKGALLGQPRDRLTSKEIKHLRSIIRGVTDALVKLAPFMPLTVSHLHKVDTNTISIAADSLVQVGASLSRQFGEMAGRYPIVRFQGLMKELHLAFFSDETESPFLDVLKHIPAFAAMKGVFLKPPFDEIREGDWPVLLSESFAWYSVYLRFSYAQKNYEHFSSGEGLRQVERVIEIAHDLISRSVLRHPEAVVGFTDLDRLIDQLLEIQQFRELFDLRGPEETLAFAQATKTVIKPIFYRLTKLDDPAVRPDEVRGLTVGVLDQLWKPFRRWIRGQHFAESIFLKLPHGIDSMPKRSALFEMVSGPQAVEASADREAFRHLLQTYPPYFSEFPGMTNEQGIVQFPWSASGWGYWSLKPDPRIPVDTYERSLTHFSVTGFIESFYRSVMDAYASKDPERGLSFEENVQMYNDIRPLGVQLGFFDSKTATGGEKRTMEANLFLSHSDGDTFISLEEAVEQTALLVSARGVAKRFYQGLTVSGCKKSKDLSTDGTELFESRCAWRNLLAQVSLKLPQDQRDRLLEKLGKKEAIYLDPLRSFPGLRSAYQKWSSDDREEFEESVRILTGEGYIGSDGLQAMGLGELDVLSSTLHYVESLFQVFDLNRDGFMDNTEAKRAFPRFRHVLSEIPVIGKDRARAIYYYLLKYGAPPDVSWNPWSWVVDGRRYVLCKIDCDFKAPRARVFGILAKLTEARSQNPDWAEIMNVSGDAPVEWVYSEEDANDAANEAAHEEFWPNDQDGSVPELEFKVDPPANQTVSN